MEGQCTASAFQQFNRDCIYSQPCKECSYWPIYPCHNPVKPMIHCMVEYDNDKVAKGTGLFMYSALEKEGQDARLLIFSPAPEFGISGGHKSPRNQHAWMAGCLGITEQCTVQCEQSFLQCTNGIGPTAFNNCFKEEVFLTLPGCSTGCSPTLRMLQVSEQPLVTANKDHFGTPSPFTQHVRPSASVCINFR